MCVCSTPVCLHVYDRRSLIILYIQVRVRTTTWKKTFHYYFSYESSLYDENIACGLKWLDCLLKNRLWVIGFYFVKSGSLNYGPFVSTGSKIHIILEQQVIKEPLLSTFDLSDHFFWINYFKREMLKSGIAILIMVLIRLSVHTRNLFCSSIIFFSKCFLFIYNVL